jgi:hypothetical protein
MIESNVAKVCMSIEAAKAGLAKVHQNFAGTFDVAAVFPIVRLYDGVGKRIFVRVFLFHFFLLVGCQAQPTGLPITSVICLRASNQH